jgi:thioredoxin-related protein
MAAELVMVDSKACAYCNKFRREVAGDYVKSDAGRIAPLRTVYARKKWPEDLAAVTPADQTPVFILVEDGQEIGRFPGYTGVKAFWSHLNPLLAKLDTAAALAPEQPPAGAGGLW